MVNLKFWISPSEFLDTTSVGMLLKREMRNGKLKMGNGKWEIENGKLIFFLP